MPLMNILEMVIKINENQEYTVECFIKERKNVEKRSYLASYDEVSENEYNISVNTYLKGDGSEKPINIKEVNSKIAEVVPKQQQIRKELEEIIKELEVDYHE